MPRTSAASSAVSSSFSMLTSLLWPLGLSLPGDLSRAIAVGMAGAGRVGSELGQQALPVALAHAGGPGQPGARRGLSGRQLNLVGRPHPGTSASRCAPIRFLRLGCGVVARPVRVYGFEPGLLFGPRCGWSGYPPSPTDLLHEQVGGE